MAKINEVYPARRSESARTLPVCAAGQCALLSRSFHGMEPAP